MNRTNFENGMKLLSATWPDRSPSAQTMTAYWMAVSHLDDTSFGEAVKRCLRECTFFPAPAEILRRAEAALTTAGMLPAEPEAMWPRVLSAARRWHAAMAPVEWDDPDVERSLREIGGLRAIAMATDDDVTWLRKGFIDRYAIYRQRRIADDLRLMGQALPAGDEPLRLSDRRRAS